MKVFVGLLILCGIYSTHSASVRVPESPLCADEEDGTFFPVIGECSRFYVCMQGEAVFKSCGPKIHYDAISHTCIDASKSLCVDGVQSIVEKPKPEMQVVAKDICAGKAIGAFVPSKTNCNEFYVCFGSTARVKVCPKGLHFNPDTQSCIDARLSICVAKADVAVEKEEEKQEEPQETKTEKVVDTTIFAETVCLGQPNGAKFAFPGSCSKYFNCLQHKGYEKSCGIRHFDSTARSCIDVENSKCVESSLVGSLEVKIDAVETNNDNGVKTANEKAEHKKTQVSSDLGKNNNVNSDNSDLPSSVKYIVSEGKLIGNNRIVAIKQTGLPVNKKAAQHVEKVELDISSFEEDDSDDVLTSDETIVDAESDVGKANRDVSFGNISLNAINTDLTVDVNLENGPNKAIEGNSNQGNDNSAKFEKENKQIVIAVIDEDSADACSGIPSGTLLSKNGNCNKFLTCESGVAFVGNCPRGLHFNAKAKFCDWPELAGCE